MKLSVVTDEVSADFETALELARGWSLEAVEIRGIGEKRYPMLSKYWMDRVPDLVAEAGLKVAALSPGLFKIPYPQPPRSETRILRWEDAMMHECYTTAEKLVQYHLEEILPASIEAAKALGAGVIVCFSFDRGHETPADTPPPQEVIDILREAAQKVDQAGLTLAVEVEHICWGDTGERTARLVERVGVNSLGINWDPANAYRAGEDHPFPDGYRAVRELIRHVHYKNATTDQTTGERVFVFDGVVDWQGQVSALLEDGYAGYISVETHFRPKVEMAKLSIDRLRNFINEGISHGL
jgi:sugar phosphate isomerase/epimerase